MFKYLPKKVEMKNVRFLYSTKVTSAKVNFVRKPCLTEADTLNKLYDTHKSSILYSSFIENTKLKLGYKKNKIVCNLIKKKTENLQKDATRIKPLSLAAQLFDEKPKGKGILEYDNLLELQLLKKSSSLDEKFSKISSAEGKLIEDLKLTLINGKGQTNEKTTWLSDYETYGEGDDELSAYGTSDPTVPVSKVPCHGCGAFLQCADSGLPGYLPSELFCGHSDNILKTLICQRCHFLKTYNTAIDLTVKPDEYIKMISTIKDKFALVILLVDLTDFPCSIWPNITEIIGTKRPVFIVGNKVDLLPKDCPGYLNHVKLCLEKAVVDSGISEANIEHTCLVSAETGYGIEELINKLHNIWGYKGDVYVMGCTNVGKSSLFNALLRSDYCKVKASNIIQKATASPWPGTTLRLLKFPILRPSDMKLYQRTRRLISEQSEKAAEQKLRKSQALATGKTKYATVIGHIGKTFDCNLETNDPFSIGTGFQNPILTIDENAKEYQKSKWFYDTPGVIQSEQILNLLTTEELLLTIPKEMITPRTFLMKPNMSLFLAGLGRVDYVQGCESIRLTVYAAAALPILIVKTENADTIYQELLGTEFLAVPIGDENRLKRWPLLQSVECNIFGEGEEISGGDILLSSAGWISAALPKNEVANFLVWTPELKGIFIRKPSLIPYGVQLRGPRIRRTLAYRSGAAFVKA